MPDYRVLGSDWAILWDYLHGSGGDPDMNWNQWRADNIHGMLDFSNIRLSSIDMRGIDLRQVMLAGADLSGANLSGADLAFSIFRYADLSGANLSRTDLSRVVLASADLSGADLSGATLCYANLQGVRGLTQDQLDSTRSYQGAINLPDGLNPDTRSREDPS